jgi:hypothetical protein
MVPAFWVKGQGLTPARWSSRRSRAGANDFPAALGGQCRSRVNLGCMRLHVFATLVHDLRFVLVEIETGVELRLLRKEIFETRFVLEGATELGTVITEGLLLPLDFMAFVLGVAIKATEGMLDTRNRSKRVVGVQIGFVGLAAANEKVRLTVFVGASAAQDFEAFEMASHLDRRVVAP